jgi:Holliday junction resolvase
MQSKYHCGVGGEKKVASKLKRMGASWVEISPGSRGAADVVAVFPTGRKLAVQVKTSCSGGTPKSLSGYEKKRLLKMANDTGCTPVTAKVGNGRIDLSYLRTGRKVV